MLYSQITVGNLPSWPKKKVVAICENDQELPISIIVFLFSFDLLGLGDASSDDAALVDTVALLLLLGQCTNFDFLSHALSYLKDEHNYRVFSNIELL
uniref:Ovule protein n=1 Tax=Ascaris lumbricoides TaxID=6252 RepID=A0A0M3ISQ1_ASCLU